MSLEQWASKGWLRRRKIVAVLQLPPVNLPESAVKVAIAAKGHQSK